MVRIKDGRVSVRKAIIYLLFGIGALLLGLAVLPAERLFIRSEIRFRKTGRRTVTLAYRFIVRLCMIFGIVRFEGAIPDFSDAGGKIIAPNHPSLLDVVILFALIPGANCIVRGGLVHSVVGAIVSALYIANNEDFEQLKHDCACSLARNETLIIFPEGTRTRKGQPVTIKRGTACIALSSGAPIIPLYIGGNDKNGLRKKDPFWKINDNGYYTYTFTKGEEINPHMFDGKNERERSIRLTGYLENLYREHVRETVLS